MHRYRILIVDDDRLLQKSLLNILREQYDCRIAGSGEEALRLLTRHPADLVYSTSACRASTVWRPLASCGAYSLICWSS